MSRTATRLALWALALGLVAWAGWLWPDVPGRIPTHFGAGGEPDAWADRSVLSWFGLPALGLALAAFLDGIVVWVHRHPELRGLNLPQKEAILDLPPERRGPVLDRSAATTYAVGAACLVAFVLIHLGTWAAAHGASGAGWVLAGVAVAVVGPVVALGWGLWAISAEIREQKTAPSP